MSFEILDYRQAQILFVEYAIAIIRQNKITIIFLKKHTKFFHDTI